MNLEPFNFLVQNSTNFDGNTVLNQTNTFNLTRGNDTQNWDSEFNDTLQFNNKTGIFDNSTQNGNETDWSDVQFNSTSTFENGTMNNLTNYGKFS